MKEGSRDFPGWGPSRPDPLAALAATGNALQPITGTITEAFGFASALDPCDHQQRNPVIDHITILRVVLGNNEHG